MADFIDRGDLLHNLRMMPMHKIFDRDVWEVNAVSYYVEQAQTIDAVPVVRCKDCAMYIPSYSGDGQVCGRNNLYRREDDYCSYGLRKEEST